MNGELGVNVLETAKKMFLSYQPQGAGPVTAGQQATAAPTQTQKKTLTAAPTKETLAAVSISTLF